MSPNNGAPVLAIGLDAAHPELIREMIEHDELPALKSLLAQGKWIRVESPTSIGSSAVWPTFMTGEDPAAHGVYGEWCWEPATMSLSRFNGLHLTPFWKALSEAGTTVGILEVPFMPLIGLSHGFEISQWGPHVLLDGGLQFGPSHLEDLVKKQTAAHPLSSGRIGASGPDDYENLQNLISACLEGASLRGMLARRLLMETKPRLAIIVFTETHHSAHYLWNTVEPENELYNDHSFKNLRPGRQTFKNIYQEVDRQVERLIETVGAEATVLVFSLQGMRPARGIPVFLEPLLCEMGFSRLGDWNHQSWTERAMDLIEAVKRRTPAALRKLYYKTVPPGAIVRLARPTMLPRYDWAQTRAFSLPTDQHGWIRINLIGREAKGIVPVEQYVETCQQLEKWLRTLTRQDGKPLVSNVIRTAQRAEDALTRRIPDLVVHWEDAAFASPLCVEGSTLEFQPEGIKYVSQHTFEGFCILKGPADREYGDVVAAKDMGALITNLL